MTSLGTEVLLVTGQDVLKNLLVLGDEEVVLGFKMFDNLAC